jgi:NAD(P)-dependent dehydrogenase (short-subunit alcohol dehydrogenase family)
LAAAGAKVAIFDVSEAVGQKQAAAIGGAYFNVNVADDAAVTEGIAAAEALHGIARILVNCAGIGPFAQTVGKDGQPHSLDVFRRTIEVNLVGIDGERGVIVNTASVAAFEGQIGQAAYSASKGGIVGMTITLARDLARHHIRVITIAPGIFLTPLLMTLNERVRESLGAQVPHPSRLGRPEEYAQMVEAIIANPMLNGEVIRLDGALRMAPK